MGHLIWNRVIDGKLTPSKATNLFMSTDRDIYIICRKNSISKTPLVMKLDNKKFSKYVGSFEYTANAGVFWISSDYGSISPDKIFPYEWNNAFVKNKEAVLRMCGDYEHENDDVLSGFVDDLYGTIQNPESPETDCFNRTLGWCSVWWTEDKKEANQMLKLIKGCLK